MHPVVAHGVAWSLCLSHSRAQQKLPEPIEMSFGTSTQVGPKKRVFDGGTHWRHLANTIEWSMWGCDAA